MSVLINMKMPTSCEDCPMGFSVNFGILCTPTHNIVGDNEISKKQGFCPLIPVPPHERMIDADALAVHKFVCAEHDISNADGGACYRRGWDDAVDAIMVNAPTVIPASEEVYGQYTDTAGNFHWCGTHSGEHKIKAEE